MLRKLLFSAAISAAMLAPLHADEILQGRAISPNPNGALDQLFILNGNTVSDEKLTLDMPSLRSGLKPGQSQTLRILHVNDLHGHLVDFHRKGDTHRMAQISKIVKDQRKGSDPVLFLSVGDEHIGTVWDELLGASAQEFQASAPYAALSAAGLDMAVVGNHELDKGSALLARAIEQDAAFPVLTANLSGSKFNMPWAPAAIGEINGMRVGFIGLTSIIDTYLETEEDPNLKGFDPARVAGHIAAAMTDKVDLIIVMSHVGFNGDLGGDAEPKYNIKVGDVQIMEAVTGASDRPAVLVGGHTHTVLNKDGLSPKNLINGAPLTQAGEYGKFVGEVTVTLTADKANKVSADFAARLIPIKGRNDEAENDLDLDLQKNVLDPMKKVLDTRLEKPIGKVDQAPELSDSKVVTDRYVGETAIANFMNDAIVARSKHWPTGPVDFAAFNATGMRGVNQEGDLTYAEWYKVMPYADEILIFDVTGAQIKNIVEDNARRIVRPEELVSGGGKLEPSSFISRGFQHFSSGIRYEIEPGSNAMETKAVNITLDGKPIDTVLNKSYRMVFNSYVSNGREGFNGGSIKGLPEAIKGYDLKSLRKTAAKNTYLLYRGQIIDYILNDADGYVGAKTGAKYDQRVVVRP